MDPDSGDRTGTAAIGSNKTRADDNKINLVLTGDTSYKVFLALDLHWRLEARKDAASLSFALQSIARQARVNRDIELLESTSNLMLDLFPEGQAAQVASYYRAYCLQAKGNVTGGRTLLSKVIGGISSHFKPRAILALATSFFDAGEYAACREIYFEAARAAVGADPLTESQAIRGTAIIAAIDGNHEQSLSILTNLVPVMRFLGDSYPADLYDHFNSIAIELGELGRVEEANRLIDQVLCSPFAKNSPHWLDTKLELASKPRRVFAPFVMALGAIEPTEEPFTAELSPRSKKSAARNKAAHIPLKAMLLRSVIARVPTQGEPITAHSKHTHQTLSGYSPSRPIRGPPPLSTLAYAQLIMAIGSN